jgi:hypothetical protein
LAAAATVVIPTALAALSAIEPDVFDETLLLENPLDFPLRPLDLASATAKPIINKISRTATMIFKFMFIPQQ